MGDIPYCKTHNGWLSQLSCERCELEEELTKAQQEITNLGRQLRENNWVHQSKIADLTAQISAWREMAGEREDMLNYAQDQLAQARAALVDLGWKNETKSP